MCSALALAVALGTGTAYAAATVRSSDIVNGQVKSSDLAEGAVTSAKLHNVPEGLLFYGARVVSAGQVTMGVCNLTGPLPRRLPH